MTKFTVKNKLTKVFEELEKQGIISRQNFSCCSNCGGYEITGIAVEKIKNGTSKEEIKGCCFYHNQDEDGWKEGQNLMLRYGDMDSTEFGEIGLPTIEVGKIICSELDKENIVYTWDQNPNKCIEVHNPDRRGLNGI
jgi:hypothetical protein